MHSTTRVKLKRVLTSVRAFKTGQKVSRWRNIAISLNGIGGAKTVASHQILTRG